MMNDVKRNAPGPRTEAGPMKGASRGRARVFMLAASAVVVVLGFAAKGLCQSYLWMTPEYSTYTNYSTDGTYIYTSMTVDGYTSGSCPTQPAQLANECHSTTHKPEVYNTVGDVGGWEAGSAVYWADYLSGTNDQQIAATPGTEYTFSAAGDVVCSFIGGAIYQASMLLYLSIAETTMEVTGDNGNGICTGKPDCSGGVTPRCPIYIVSDSVPCHPGFFCLTLAYRTSKSSSFSCLPPAVCVPTSTLPGPCN